MFKRSHQYVVFFYCLKTHASINHASCIYFCKVYGEVVHMKQNRQDTWNEAEDEYLKDVTLQFIKLGKTQLEAFKKVAKDLNRTAAACGFRWNATIRKYYEKEILEAKQQKQLSSMGKLDLNHNPQMNEVISLLQQLKPQMSNVNVLQQEMNVMQLHEENQQLKEELISYKNLFKKMTNLLDDLYVRNELS